MAQVCRGQSRFEARIPARNVRKINMTLMDALVVAFRRSPPCMAAGFSSSTNRNGGNEKITPWKGGRGESYGEKLNVAKVNETIFLKLNIFFQKDKRNISPINE